MKKILAAMILTAFAAGVTASAAMPFGDRGPGPVPPKPGAAVHQEKDKRIPPGQAKKIEKKDNDRRDDRRDERRDDRRDERRDDRRDEHKAPPHMQKPDLRRDDRGRKAPPPPKDRHNEDDNDNDRGGLIGKILEQIKD